MMKPIGYPMGRAFSLFVSIFALSSCANGICHPIKHPELAAAAGVRQASTCSATNDCAQNPQPVTSTATDMTMQSQMGTNPTGSFGPGVTNNSTNNNSIGSAKVAGLSDVKTVVVYKADGSLQCNMGRSIPADEMEKQLSGIRVISRKRQSDGKMHMQVCGSATGFINVYEIPETSLSDALARGFKKL